MKCQQKKENPSIDIDTKICKTEKICTLHDGTEACHLITIFNYKQISLHADVIVESAEGRVSYTEAGCSVTEKSQIHLPPAENCEPSQTTVRFKIEKDCDRTDIEERLELKVFFYLRSEGNKKRLPDLYPEVDIV